jgi:4-aminobutyrate aminotransferase/(S)-3-amino-2-methylpropionate transaminase
MMIGIELVRDRLSREPDSDLAGRTILGALERGVLILASGPDSNVISLSPPLNIDRAQLDAGASVLEQLLGDQ